MSVTGRDDALRFSVDRRKGGGMRSTAIIIAALFISASHGLVSAGDETDRAPDSGRWFVSQLRAHGLGVWYPSGLGEISLGRDSEEYESSLGAGLSMALALQRPGSRFGFAVGGRWARVTFDSVALIYGGVPPWGWTVERRESLNMVEPFVSFETAPGVGSGFRLAGQLGYHLVSGLDYGEDVGSASLSLDAGFNPVRAKAPRTRPDVTVRATVVFDSDATEGPIFLVSIGLGIVHDL
jgi:hypothetical protein